ncbi:MAG: diacylglycerol kinase [Treponema sp.]|nr:diacylglycerol kinase [Treponema sp.]
MDYFFAKTITEICERSLLSVDRPLRCMIVVNPVAGGFFIRSKWESHIRTLTKYSQKAQANPKREIYKNVILNITEGKGSAGEITKAFIERSLKDPIPFYLIISAGGDGTHREVMNALFNAPVHVRRTMAVLRLPLGTGNDSADSPSLAGALDLLLKPVHIQLASAVQLIPKKDGPTHWKGPFLAFNICSVGLDAYVTHQTNIMKGKTPGDSYRFWVDMATLSYHKKYKVDFFNVRGLNKDNSESAKFKEKLLLLAMGVSGKRTYGSQQPILPDDRNVCAIKNTSLLGKLAVKGKVAKGKHGKSRHSILFNAHRVDFAFGHPILAQMDGETILLQPEDFPAAMELTAPVIPLLKLTK